jgi:hypothetical protein
MAHLERAHVRLMIYEFYEPIAVDTPLGTGRALFVERTPHDNFWTVALDDNCALVTFPQNKLRMHRSYTQERCLDDKEMRSIVNRR